MKRTLTLMAMAALTGMSGAAFAQAVGGATSQTASVGNPVPDEIIPVDLDQPHDPFSVLVRVSRDGDKDLHIAAAAAMVGGDVITEYTIVPGLVHMSIGVPVEDALALLGQLPFVEYAEPDYIMSTQVLPNDPSIGNCWGLHNTGQTVNGDPGINDADIDAAEAWNTYTGDPNFVVAIIDTGLNYNHSDLSANAWTNPGEIAGNGIDDDGNGYIDDTRGWDFYNNDNNPIDDNGHGTHCGGTIGARGNNGIGVAGVNWQCKLVGLKFLGGGGSGSTAGAVSALQYCTGKGIRLSSNSWGGGGSSSLSSAINAARTAGHLFVAAAGNAGSNNDSSPFYPASYNYDNIISVAATDNNDAKASFSNYGVTSVDVGAPGVTIYSTYGSSYAYLNGTSMACPHASGLAALVWGKNPNWTYGQVRSRIFSTVRPTSSMNGRVATGGIINAASAIGSSGGNTAPTVTITAPVTGSSFVQGFTIQFTGSSLDDQDGDIGNGLVWTSSISGQIGTGKSFTRNDLPLGTHTITASSTDTGGLTSSKTTTITLTQGGGNIPNPPVNPLARKISATSIRFSWTDASNNESYFVVERQTLIGGNWTNTTSWQKVAGVQSHTDFPGNGTFRYRVAAGNSNGQSAFTGYVQISLP